MSSRWTVIKTLNICCALDLNSNLIFSQDNPTNDDVLSNQVWLQMNQHFGKYSRKSHFDYMSFYCDFDFEGSKSIFSLETLAHDDASTCQVWLKKKFSCSENIVWTFIDTLKFCCDLDLEHSIPFFHKTLRLMIMYHTTKCGCKRISRSEDTVKTVIFFNIWTFNVTLTLKTAHWSFCMTL